MVAYLTILGTALAAFAGAGLPALATGAVLLFVQSLISHHALLRAVQERGATSIYAEAYATSLGHALAASAAAFVLGSVVRLVFVG